MTNLDVIEKFIAHYKFALDSEYIAKPLSYALYHTWKYCDSHERPRKIEKKIKVREVCGNCEYLDMNIKSTVGYECNRPNWKFRTATAHLKQKTCTACKDFKLRKDKGDSDGQM